MTIRIDTKNNETIHAVLSYVAMATDKHDVRQFINCIHYNDGTLLGTNGHRLHTVTIPMPELENGPYKVIKLNKTFIELEPMENVRGIAVPDTSWNMWKSEGLNLIDPGFRSDMSEYPMSYMWRIIRSLVNAYDQDKGFDFNYLSDAFSYGVDKIYNGKDRLFTECNLEGNSALIMRAVVMSMRVN